MPLSAPAELALSDAAGRRGLDSVSVHDRVADVWSDWHRLLAVAPASAYQTPAWIEAWLATLGQGVQPFFVVGRDARGPVALLPLGRRRRLGLATARYLGGRDSNFGLGLFHPGVAWDQTLVVRLLGEAARLGAIDLFWLGNQPGSFGSAANPLVVLPAVPSPSLQHEAALGTDPGLSSRARKHLRQKEAKLATVGPVRHEVADGIVTAERIVATLLAQRQARFGPRGDETALRGFLLAAAAHAPGTPAAVELHALRCDDVIIATFAGAGHAGRFSGMMMSFADEPAWARFSPGDLLVARIMAAKTASGCTVFDLGIGEARYKSSFCPTPVSLVDVAWGATARGRVTAGGLRMVLTGKRAIKQSAWLWPLVARWRSKLRRLSGRFAAGHG